ncbi:uncharacterized protein [Leptinotarsa decemlineata]|uniref:uncharacterized protein n=1 Tax=Leptinotarsa decemlineata TaxID=7539 RepID=UPI003D30AB6F
MRSVEKFCLREPEWILDRIGSGPLFWRRDSSETNSRVRFRYDVDVKEFHRPSHELEDNSWLEQGAEILTASLCVTFCITVTVFLPWFLLVAKN